MKAKRLSKQAKSNVPGLAVVDEVKGIDTKLPKLTDKQRLFCEEYILDLNATQAALRAGYCARTVNKSGPANLVKVGIQTEIQRLKAIRSKRTNIKADDVILELAKIGFSNIEDYLTVDEDGETHLKNFDDIKREVLAAVESIKISTTKNKDDSREYITTQFKLHSKLNALEQLGKHLGIYQKDKVIDVGENLQSFIDWLVGRNGNPKDTSRDRPLLTG